jgi:hypothetical protein
MPTGRRPLAFSLAGSLAGLGFGILAWGEFEHWRSSRRRLGTRPGRDGTGEAIVVLGFRNRGTRANTLNRWRVRAALRSRQPGSGPSRLVLSGGPVGGPVPEAELMACYAREERGYPGVLITELTSRSTWENVRNAIPYIEDADRRNRGHRPGSTCRGPGRLGGRPRLGGRGRAPGRADGGRDVVRGGQLLHGLVDIGGPGRAALQRALALAAGPPVPRARPGGRPNRGEGERHGDITSKGRY